MSLKLLLRLDRLHIPDLGSVGCDGPVAEGSTDPSTFKMALRAQSSAIQCPQPLVGFYTGL